MNKQMLMVVLGIALTATSCKYTKSSHEATVYTITTPEVTNTFISKDYVAKIQSQKNIEIKGLVLWIYWGTVTMRCVYG